MSFPRKKSLNQTRTILVASCNEQSGPLQKHFPIVPVADEMKALSPRDRTGSAGDKQLSPRAIVTEAFSDNRKQSSPRAQPAMGHDKDKNGSLENLLTLDDLDEAFYNSAINKHNQVESNQNFTKTLNLSEFGISEEHTKQTKLRNQDQKSDDGRLQLAKEESKKTTSTKTTDASTFADVKTQEQRNVEDSISVEEITLPANINLTYSRYNGKKNISSTHQSIVKPGKPDIMDKKDKAKAKSKRSKKKVWIDQEEETYHIAMAGHMPQVSVTEAFTGTGDLKQTVKKENKVEILARLKKGSIYKLFNKPTKVKKFKLKEEKVKDQQQEEKKSKKGIRKYIQRVIGNIRNAFRACGCF